MKDVYYISLNFLSVNVKTEGNKFFIRCVAKQDHGEKFIDYEFDRNDENKKKEFLDSIQKWFIKNGTHKYCQPKYFINEHLDYIKKAIRLKEWKTLDQLKRERQGYVNGIDEYPEYIDNYKQQKEVEKHNEECLKMINLYDQVISQMQALSNNFSGLTYSFGLFRYKTDNGFKYIRFEKQN